MTVWMFVTLDVGMHDFVCYFFCVAGWLDLCLVIGLMDLCLPVYLFALIQI
jgi:hypothetical protein